ncbi:hypothetical protein OnM2_092047 [Erysiphe neolycopersici]|uniref:Uncharacterized protein n=1 Tax=Erysiphe neolycopersici TaxID=212602 RepID=A0A420HCL6_9PEZI|nr:hypothetical protein OnM2_092047 [Erysiphe neolycopersici]
MVMSMILRLSQTLCYNWIGYSLSPSPNQHSTTDREYIY